MNHVASNSHPILVYVLVQCPQIHIYKKGPRTQCGSSKPCAALLPFSCDHIESIVHKLRLGLLALLLCAAPRVCNKNELQLGTGGISKF